MRTFIFLFCFTSSSYIWELLLFFCFTSSSYIWELLFFFFCFTILSYIWVSCLFLWNIAKKTWIVWISHQTMEEAACFQNYQNLSCLYVIDNSYCIIMHIDLLFCISVLPRNYNELPKLSWKRTHFTNINLMHWKIYKLY